jgi:hypothetical protein
MHTTEHELHVDSIILSVVVYGFETWPLTLRDESIMREFKNKALRGMFG